MNKQLAASQRAAHNWIKNGDKRILSETFEDNGALVVVQGGHAVYTVGLWPDSCFCNCMRFKTRRVPCKHIFYVLYHYRASGDPHREQVVDYACKQLGVEIV